MTEQKKCCSPLSGFGEVCRKCVKVEENILDKPIKELLIDNAVLKKQNKMLFEWKFGDDGWEGKFAELFVENEQLEDKYSDLEDKYTDLFEQNKELKKKTDKNKFIENMKNSFKKQIIKFQKDNNIIRRCRCKGCELNIDGHCDCCWCMGNEGIQNCIY
jgi:DNA repair exonuclease SbcCD ATPase subunit